MAIRIDDGFMQRLVTTQLQNVGVGVVYAIGEQVPEVAEARTVLASISLEPVPRHSTDDVDLANVEVELELLVGPEQASGYAIGELAARVCAALAEITVYDSTTSHEVEMGPARRVLGTFRTESRTSKYGAVVVNGTVKRTSGDSIAAVIA